MTEFTPVNAWADPPTTISVHVDTGDSQINVASLPPGVPIGPCAFPVLVMDNRDPRLATTAEQMLVTNVGGTGNLVWDVTRVYGSGNPGSAQTHEPGDDVYLNQTIESLRGMGVVDAPVAATTLRVAKDWGLTGPINISITANQNNWNPTGFATASHILLTTDASRNITGLVAPSYPRRVLIENVGSFNFVLKGQDSGSSAANRVAGSDVTVLPGLSIEIIYDPTVMSRWLVIGGTGSSLSFAAPSAEAIGSSQSTGSATTVNHSDHVHAMPGFAVPSAEAVGSSQATGSNTTVNHSDHVHAMPGAFVAAGGSHAAGFVPDPGATTHSPEKVLTESGWNVLPAHASTHSKGGPDEVEIEDLATDITDTTLVLAPDGAGGLAFRAETGGGGGAIGFVNYTGGAITIPTGGFAELSSSLRITLDAAVGDILEVSLNAIANPGASSIYAFDIATIVSGAIQNKFAGGSDGAAGWLTDIAVTSKNELTGSVWYAVQSGDLVSGQVTVSLIGNRVSGAAAGTVSASATDPLFIAARVGAGTGGTPAAGGLVLLEQHSASSSATLVFTSFVDSALYDNYFIMIQNLVPATDNVSLLLRCSTNGGSTYDSGSNYSAVGGYSYSGGVGVAGFSSDSATAMAFLDTISNNANWGLSGDFYLYGLSNTAVFSILVGQSMMFHATLSKLLGCAVTGAYKVTTAVDALQFLFSSGNIASGTIRVYGVAK